MPSLISRRTTVAAIGAALATPSITGRAQGAARTLRISHQFPASSGDSGDFRDRMCHKFADDVAVHTDNELRFEIYPNASLMNGDLKPTPGMPRIQELPKDDPVGVRKPCSTTRFAHTARSATRCRSRYRVAVAQLA